MTAILTSCIVLSATACGKKSVDTVHAASNRAIANEQCSSGKCRGGFVKEKGSSVIFLIGSDSTPCGVYTISDTSLMIGDGEWLDRLEIILPADTEWPAVAVEHAKQFVH
ncbi:MAG: hypothetical protein A2675_04275 [Candidatus Yonathbacteria bacterium RIFCSPHIGHO2_01_FULL_51_10]|uniref:Uncharacterized protein n=1 Tax=Candidatus Yonathbacteria bacterium RIFCSPHIGHO2_01_FULL_51_10 TaxID=1802723 RepID=A0A1G2S5S9_9BACT|nr:MAG: hypothetical protein A2675_04275 [Candidatus Yonathbacteria bacterium RIFCSPHIGHO2_01_FULL_51_10]